MNDYQKAKAIARGLYDTMEADLRTYYQIHDPKEKAEFRKAMLKGWEEVIAEFERKLGSGD